MLQPDTIQTENFVSRHRQNVGILEMLSGEGRRKRSFLADAVEDGIREGQSFCLPESTLERKCCPSAAFVFPSIQQVFPSSIETAIIREEETESPFFSFSCLLVLLPSFVRKRI